MPEIQEEVYQDNGFELVIYRQRQPDTYKTCPACKNKLFAVASLYDAWQERQSTLVEYFHCKKCKHLVQETTRDRPDGKSSSQQIQKIPPYEMQMQLLAHARHIQGRGITRLTLNRRWWQAWRYPLVLSKFAATRMPRVRAVTQDSSLVKDDQVLHTVPLPRYQPTDAQSSNPFTSRRLRKESDPTPETEEFMTASPAEDDPPSVLAEDLPGTSPILEDIPLEDENQS